MHKKCTKGIKPVPMNKKEVFKLKKGSVIVINMFVKKSEFIL